SLEVWGSPDGAEVLVNDKPAGHLPLGGPIRVTAGPPPTKVRAAGLVGGSRRGGGGARARGRGRFGVSHRGDGSGAADVAAAPDPSNTGGGGDAQPGVDLRAHDQPGGGAREASSPVYKRWWFWTAIGAVVVGGAVTAFVLTRPKGASCAAGEMCTSIGP